MATVTLRPGPSCLDLAGLLEANVGPPLKGSRYGTTTSDGIPARCSVLLGIACSSVCETRRVDDPNGMRDFGSEKVMTQ